MGPRDGTATRSSSACTLTSEMTDSTSGQATAIEQRPGKRERLVAAAIQLLHQQGIERTTLADIAKAADVPAGNVYYYFKTKDEVIAAVIEAHTRAGQGDPRVHRRSSPIPQEPG